VQGEDAVIVRWEIVGAGEAQLEARPLVAFRSHHALASERETFKRNLTETAGLLVLEPEEGLPALHFSHDARRVVSDGYWYRQFMYQVEKERGYDCEEDLFNPCAFVARLAPGKPFTIVASTSGCGVADASRLLERERTRRRAFAVYVSPAVALLKRAADQFLVRRGEGYTVIAGYPWFTDWGRDTMISLPGLTLATRRHDVARSILETFARHVSQGLIPNRFPDAAGDAPEYNTIDATLWMFQAARAYLDASHDTAFAERITPLFDAILEEHERGTRHGIHVTGDGLLSGGEPGAALTWMDARIDGEPVTPRRGKAVEIQALWYGAVRITAELLRRSNPALGPRELEEARTRIAASFRALLERRARHLDVVTGTGWTSIREPAPRDLAAHHHSAGEDARRLLDGCARSSRRGPGRSRPEEPAYRPPYEGGTSGAANHQGTVWPWLIWAFVDALFAVQGASEAAVRRLRHRHPASHLGARASVSSRVCRRERPHRAGAAADLERRRAAPRREPISGSRRSGGPASPSAVPSLSVEKRPEEPGSAPARARGGSSSQVSLLRMARRLPHRDRRAALFVFTAQTFGSISHFAPMRRRPASPAIRDPFLAVWL
jgi:glycogen debranching enzyme